MRRTIAAAVFMTALFAAGLLVVGPASQAKAQISLGIGDNHNSFSLSIGAPPVYMAPPVYVAPAPPVYVAPPPVYVAPRPHYVAPAPRYVAPRSHYAPAPRYVAPRNTYHRAPAHPAHKPDPRYHR